MRFEANQGQTDSRVKFLVHGPEHTLFLTPDEAVLRLRQSTSSLKTPTAPSSAPTEISAPLLDTIHLSLAGAQTPGHLEGLDELQTRSNYFIGNDPHKWHTNVTNYARVRYSQVYPGIDLIYYGNQERLEYDFQIAPGADPRAIAMEFKGVRRLFLDGEGNLLLHARNNKLVLHRPVTYQEINASGRTYLLATR
jgi:hypothetical protein